MTDSIWVRPLDPLNDADIHAALVIFRQAFEDSWEERFLRKALKKNHYALLSGSGELACGCLLYRHFRTERDILGIGVLRDALHLGYGTALIHEMKRLMIQAKAQCTVTVYITPNNQVAQHTFYRTGFEWAWTEPNYAGQGPLRIFRWIPTWPEECGEAATESVQK